MKKKLIVISSIVASIFIVLLIFSSYNNIKVSTATTLGTIKVGEVEKTFTTSTGLVNTMANMMSNECINDYSNKNVVLTLCADVTDSDFLPKTPSGGNLWHNSVTINLNGYTLTLTDTREHDLGSLVINGGGGKIHFDKNDTLNNPVFYFDSNSGGSKFEIKDTWFEDINASNLFYINECSDFITSIDMENCFFNNCNFTSEGGILCFYDDEITTINMTNCNFRSIRNSDYASVLYIGNRKIQNVNIKGCEFYDCESSSHGGVIYINQNNVYLGNSSNASFDKNFFVDCCADMKCGGAIFSYGRYSTIENCTFFQCGGSYGGAIYGEWNNLYIKRCSFYDNFANYYGGAVYINSYSSKMEDCILAYSSLGEHNNGIDIYCASSTYCDCVDNTFYFSGSDSFVNCNITSSQKSSLDHVKFSNNKNYSGNNLIRGDSEENPILISNTDDLYAFYINLSKVNFSKFGKLHYLLTNPLHGAPGFYDNFNEFTGTFNFGGNFLEFAVNWMWPSHTIDPWILDISDMQVHKDGHVPISVNGKTEYFIPISNKNIDFTTLTSENYYFYQNITFEDRLNIEGDVTMLINAGITVNCNAGINITSGNNLKIIGTDKSNKGILNAIASNNEGAGIGGGYGCATEDTLNNIPAYSGETMGSVTIQNMIVNAKGSKGAGIGGGAGMDGQINGTILVQHASIGGNGGVLTVQDSEIYAVGDDARDIGGGNGGDGVNIPSGGGKGTEITMISGLINATVNGIGGGHTGKAGSSGDGDSVATGNKNGGDGGKIDFKNGKIIAKGISGGNGTKSGGMDGLPTELLIPTNCGICYANSLESFPKCQVYNHSLDTHLIDNFVKIGLLVNYEFDLVNHTCYASYTLDGQTHSETVHTTHIVDTAATCTMNEIAHEHAIFTDGNIDAYDSESIPVDGTALGHNYGGHVDYNRNGNQVTASWTCQREGCDSIQTETVKLEYKVDSVATCTTNETGHLEGTFSKGFPLYATEKNSETKIDTFLGHSISGVTNYSWSNDTCTCTAYCTVCKKNVSETAKGVYVRDELENCTEDEKGHYHVDFIYNFPSSDTAKSSVNGPTKAYGHDFHGKVVYLWDEEYNCTATVMCINRDCDEVFTEQVKGRFVADIPATCVDNAIGHYVAEFTKLPGIFQTQVTKYADVEGEGTALGHNFEGKITYYWNTETNECTASWHCSRCEAVEQETVVGTFVEDSKATCEENIKGHCVAEFINENFNTGQSTEPNSVEIPNTKLGHTFGGEVEYYWDEETLQWTATQHCQVDGCDGVYSETCDGLFVEVVPPTCLDDAKGYYISQFVTEGFEQKSTTNHEYPNTGSALGHEFGGTVIYSWNDAHECTATWSCIHENCKATESETAIGRYVADIEATCLVNEFGHFVVEFKNPSFEAQSTPEHSFENLLTALGHEFGGNIAYFWNDETHECEATCGCIHGGCGESKTEIAQGVYVKDCDATCIDNEKGHYEANFEESIFIDQSTEIKSVEIEDTVLGHKWGSNIVYSWNTTTHECTASMKCDHAGCNETQVGVEQGVYVKDSDATCIDNEKGHYEATFNNEYFKKSNSNSIEIADTSIGHDLVISYSWNDDFTECIAKAECSRGDHIETMEGTISYDYGYAIAKFKDSKFKTQSVKMPTITNKNSLEEDNEKHAKLIFAVITGGIALTAAAYIFFCIKRRIF